ncbi:MAG: MBL fold metallo-hydrolase, partial [Alistipes sp.]|nr:MBL fold metallo-hydrolase [Alistipes sp.]
IHRGTHEIGGSCVEICSDKAKILIDLGMPLDYDKRSREELTEIRHTAEEWCKGVDALFLSHTHADHYGFLDLLPQDTPIYATEESFAMLALDGILGNDPTKHLEKHPLKSGQSCEVADVKVTAHIVDHSAYGACAYLIECDGKRILYSGDIRLHGVKGVLYKNLPKDVDYLLLEGTNVLRVKNSPTEREIENQFVEAFNEAPDALHWVWCSAKNIDRICALFRACIRCGKTLAIDPYTANVLATVAKLNPKIPTVTTAGQMKVYFPPRLTDRLTERNQERYIYSLNPKQNKVSYDDFSSSPEKYVMLVRPTTLTYLQRIKAPHIRLIKSIWNGYWDEPNTERLRHWVEEHCEAVKDIHSSGHADTQSLQRIVEFVRPKTIVPIHTDAPKQFCDIFVNNNVKCLDNNEVLCL